MSIILKYLKTSKRDILIDLRAKKKKNYVSWNLSLYFFQRKDYLEQNPHIKGFPSIDHWMSAEICTMIRQYLNY